VQSQQRQPEARSHRIFLRLFVTRSFMGVRGYSAELSMPTARELTLEIILLTRRLNFWRTVD